MNGKSILARRIQTARNHTKADLARRVSQAEKSGDANRLAFWTLVLKLREEK